MTDKWQHAHYICLNYGQAYAPDEIRDKSVCVNKDIGEVIRRLLLHRTATGILRTTSVNITHVIR